MPGRGLPPGVHRKKAKGRTYYYFDTGARVDGKMVLKRLPDLASKDFGPAYGQAQAARGKRKDVAPAMTVDQLTRLYEISPDFASRSASTHRTYLTYMRLIRDQIGTITANSLNAADVALLRDTMAKTTGAANMTMAVIGSIYTWGRRRGHVTAKPTENVERFDTEDYEPWPDRLVDEALASDDKIVQIAVGILYFTALRIGDACKLSWGQIKDGVIHVRQQKTKGHLSIPIHAKLAAILPKPEAITILHHHGGKRYSPETIRDRLQVWAEKRGVKVTAHGLRKNAVNALLEAGCSIGETSAISGQSLQVVEHYAKRRNRGKMAGAAILKWERNTG